MICALHNIAVEYEYQQEYSMALSYYEKSKSLASEILGAESERTAEMD